MTGDWKSEYLALRDCGLDATCWTFFRWGLCCAALLWASAGTSSVVAIGLHLAGFKKQDRTLGWKITKGLRILVAQLRSLSLTRVQGIHVLHSEGRRATRSPQGLRMNAGNGCSEKYNATYAERPPLRQCPADRCERRRQTALKDENNRHDTESL